MSDKDFVNKYLEDFSKLVKPNAEVVEKIIQVKNILMETKKNNEHIAKS